MDPALAGLAGAASAALVEAMATDFWATAKARLSRIVGRSAHATEEALVRELDESASRLTRQSPPERAAVAAEQERWTALLAAFLVERVDASAELRDFVGQVRGSLADTNTVNTVQNITVGGNAFISGRDQHLTIPPDANG